LHTEVSLHVHKANRTDYLKNDNVGVKCYMGFSESWNL